MTDHGGVTLSATETPAPTRAQRAVTEPPRPRGIRGRRGAAWPTWAAGVAFLAATLAAQRTTVLGDLTETGDLAADSLRSEHAWSQVDGVFSRWDYHHPGPVLFWLKSLAERLLTPLGLDPVGAQLVGTAVLATLSLVALALALRGPTTSRWLGPAVLALAWVGLPDGLVLVPWGPVVGNWFLVLGIAGVVAAVRGAGWGVPVALVGALGLLHLHVLFVPLAGAVLGATVLLVARRAPAGARLRRRSVLLPSAAVAVAMLAPLVVALVRGRAPWADYLRVSGDRRAGLDDATWVVGLLRVLRLLAPSVDGSGPVLAGAAGLVGVVLLVVAVGLALRGSTAPTRLLGASALVVAAYLLAVSRMDFLTAETIGRVLPVVVLAGLVAEVAARARPAWVLVAAALAVAALVVANLGRPPVAAVRHEGALRGSGAAERALADFRRSGATLLVVDHATTPWNSYAGAAALTLLAERQHVDHCVAVRRMPLWAEPSTVCAASTQGALRVFFTSPDTFRLSRVR